MANISKQKGLNLQKMSPMVAEKSGGSSSKVADSNINGRGNKCKLFTFETEFTKRRATPTNVTGRIEQFVINQNYS